MDHQGQLDRGHRARATALGAVTALLTVAGAWAASRGLLGELHRLERRSALQTFDAVPVLLWAALVLALLWAALLITLATWSVHRRDRTGEGLPADGRLSPGPGGLAGRLAGVLLAVTALSALSATVPAVAAPSAATAVAAGPAAAAPTSVDRCDGDVPTPGWVPDKPSRTDQVARECAPLVTGKAVADDSGEVVVRRGDTLWSIAAAHLGPHADAQAIAAEWPRWYAANRHVIGDDPDLLLIGTRLQSPDHVLEGTAR